ncbi:MAG: hypothetical protein K5697_01555 [Lachnospiraceae bacterium]|jgi:uncharacterized protein YukE|nr:hypothetical protein [Lachnospiraceae bacterium]
MADTKLKVSKEELLSTVGKFNANYSAVSNATSQMLTLLEGLKTVCNGEPYDGFIAKAAGLNNDMEQVKKMINGHIDELTKVAGIVDQLVQETNAAFSGLPNDVIS